MELDGDLGLHVVATQDVFSGVAAGAGQDFAGKFLVDAGDHEEFGLGRVHGGEDGFLRVAEGRVATVVFDQLGGREQSGEVGALLAPEQLELGAVFG